MNRLGRAALMVVIGVVVGRLLWSGGFGWFVQQRMRLPLIGATVVLLVFGLYEAISGAREESVDPSSASRPVGPTVGWLLTLPILVLTSVAPTSLGASAADRVEAYTPTQSASEFASMKPTVGDAANGAGGDGNVLVPADGVATDDSATDDGAEGAVGEGVMTVFEFLDRALWDDSRSLEGVPVRLEGLVVNDLGVPDGFVLTKFMVSCCAADGIPLQVTVHGTEPLENNTWVSAEVIWRPPDVAYQDTPPPWVVEADAVSVTVVPNPPSDPYESPYD